MIPRSVVVVSAAVLLAVAACAGGAPTPTSFDPAAPCAGADEQRMAGAYPALEAVLPSVLEGEPPTSRDSGRLCSKTTLGALFDAGIAEARFGGAIWDRGGGKAISLVLFSADGLTASALFDSYVAGAQADSHVHDIRTRELSVAGTTGHRLDLLNGESFQAIVVWPGDGPGRVRVLLAADQEDARIQAALDAFH